MLEWAGERLGEVCQDLLGVRRGDGAEEQEQEREQEQEQEEGEGRTWSEGQGKSALATRASKCRAPWQPGRPADDDERALAWRREWPDAAEMLSPSCR